MDYLTEIFCIYYEIMDKLLNYEITDKFVVNTGNFRKINSFWQFTSVKSIGFSF